MYKYSLTMLQGQPNCTITFSVKDHPEIASKSVTVSTKSH